LASTRVTPTRWSAARRSPARNGQSLRVLVFAKGEKAKEAEAAGADLVGENELVAKVQEGFMDFDRVIATPDMMGVVGKLGRVLGPRGLMPNPKVGTVTFDVKTAVTEAKAGKVEYRVEKAGIVHARIGKVLHRAARSTSTRTRSSRLSCARSRRPRRASISEHHALLDDGPRRPHRSAPLLEQRGGGVAHGPHRRKTGRSTIKDKFSRMTSAVFVDFKGLNVETGDQAPRRVPQERRRVPRRQEHAREARAQEQAVGEEPRKTSPA
jgi:hypothetical protein